MKITKEKAEKTLQLIEGLILQQHPKMKGLRLTQMLNKLLPENCWMLSEPVIDFDLLARDSDISFLLEPELVLESCLYEEPVLTINDEPFICSCLCHLASSKM